VAALGTGQCRLKDHHRHLVAPTTVEG
jgi:hypothetical protein